MNTQLIIFDLDGVLIDSKELHFIALNKALEEIDPKYKISIREHVSEYDGLPTKAKLHMLSEKKGLNKDLHNKVWQLKQEKTNQLLTNSIKKDLELVSLFKLLKEENFKIAVATNSIKKTLELILQQLGIINFVDLFVSHEDVTRPKPFPEMFWVCMTKLNALPSQTLIVEDSHIGRQAALNSGAHLFAVESRKDLNLGVIDKMKATLLGKSKKTPWKSENLNVLIPMAGEGSRFASQGYTFPKPLIDINGKPMIQVVVDNLNIVANYIFIVQKEHYIKYNLQHLLPLVAKGCKIIQVEGVTEGAACTTLLAKEFIDNKNPLLIANSDQFIEWDSSETMYAFTNDTIDGGILTFNSVHPKWSYAKLAEDGYVSEVAEKKPISNNATVGIYFWKMGSDYVKYAEKMIRDNTRVNNEFYICPVFNEAIKDDKKIRISMIGDEGMWGLGTPEDLKYFNERYKGLF